MTKSQFPTITSRLVKRADHHFAWVDPLLSKVIHEIGPCLLSKRKLQPFRALVSAVVGQQLSEQAASSIRRKVAGILGPEYMKWPKRLSQVHPNHLTSQGLSTAKANCLIGLAHAINSRELDFDEVAKMPDEEVIDLLIRYKGIGRWTAQMFLIFGLKRPDVISIGDTGLRRGAQLVYGLKSRPNEEEFACLAESWKPYRTIASWYLWRVLDTKTKAN